MTYVDRALRRCLVMDLREPMLLKPACNLSLLHFEGQVTQIDLHQALVPLWLFMLTKPVFVC